MTGSAADGTTIDDLPDVPGQAWVSLVVRDSQLVPWCSDTGLRAGDDVLILADQGPRRWRLAAAFTAVPHGDQRGDHPGSRGS